MGEQCEWMDIKVVRAVFGSFGHALYVFCRLSARLPVPLVWWSVGLGSSCWKQPYSPCGCNVFYSYCLWYINQFGLSSQMQLCTEFDANWILTGTMMQTSPWKGMYQTNDQMERKEVAHSGWRCPHELLLFLEDELVSTQWRFFLYRPEWWVELVLWVKYCCSL